VDISGVGSRLMVEFGLRNLKHLSSVVPVFVS
jgi:hypothetical protein